MAGATKGLGDGLVIQAENRRLAALELARNQREDKIRAEDRKQQLADRDNNRSYEEGIAGAERDRQAAKVSNAANVYESLFGTESGGDFGAKNDEGYNGRSQFGQDRLDDWSAANGAPRIDLEEFRTNPEFQKQVEKWHFEDINDYIDDNDLTEYEGKVINGVTITRSGMIAMAHLGGQGGMREFLETGGKYDPADSNKTNLSDYARTHGGKSTDMSEVWEVIADPDTPAALRDEALTEVKRRNGIAGAIELTGEEWITDGEGNEVLHGRVNGTGRMQPYTDASGQPITRKAERRDVKVSASLVNDLEQRFRGITGDVDYRAVDAVEGEIIRLMQEEDMTESEAKASATARMQYEQVVEDDGNRGWFRDDVEPTMGDGDFLYTFKPLDGEDDEENARDRNPALKSDPETLQSAREAIAEGANREAVIARLRKNGIDPKDL